MCTIHDKVLKTSTKTETKQSINQSYKLPDISQRYHVKLTCLGVLRRFDGLLRRSAFTRKIRSTWTSAILHCSCVPATHTIISHCSHHPTLPSVLWHCWLGSRKGIWPVKNWVVRYWHGCLSGLRCKWFVYGPADANATASSHAPVKSRMVYLSGVGLPRLSRKKGRQMDVVVVVV